MRRCGPSGAGAGGSDTRHRVRRGANRRVTWRGKRNGRRRKERRGERRPSVASSPLGQGRGGGTHIRDHMGRMSIWHVPKSSGSSFLRVSARKGCWPNGVVPHDAPSWPWCKLGAMRILMLLLEELNIPGNAAAAFTTVGGRAWLEGLAPQGDNGGAGGQGNDLRTAGPLWRVSPCSSSVSESYSSLMPSCKSACLRSKGSSSLCNKHSRGEMSGGIRRSSSESTSLRVAGVPSEEGEKHRSLSSHGGADCSGREHTAGAWAV